MGRGEAVLCWWGLPELPLTSSAPVPGKAPASRGLGGMAMTVVTREFPADVVRLC